VYQSWPNICLVSFCVFFCFQKSCPTVFHTLTCTPQLRSSNCKQQILITVALLHFCYKVSLAWEVVRKGKKKNQKPTQSDWTNNPKLPESAFWFWHTGTCSWYPTLLAVHCSNTALCFSMGTVSTPSWPYQFLHSNLFKPVLCQLSTAAP